MQTPHAVVIVGTGFSGLCAAIQLRAQGVDDVVLIDKADEIGGTWRENTYPGCGCDVPSHLYDFSFAPNPDWSRTYARQPEILAYLKGIVERYALRPLIRFDCALEHAAWDEAQAMWTIRTSQGELHARSLIVAVGPLHVPRLPELPGLDTFQGVAMHSAQWRDDVDLAGKRVAVVGTGASAIQIVPSIAADVADLHLFQRTPAWILPRGDRFVGDTEKALYRRMPGLLRLKRQSIYWFMELRALAMTRHPALLRTISKLALRHMRRQVPDPVLQAQLTPSYLMGCKRILPSDDFYPALLRDNVHLHPQAVASVTPTGVVGADGTAVDVDVILWATGFHVDDVLPRLPLVGRGGVPLSELWAGGAEAYLGTTVHGLPNLHFLLGPNTGLGHNSMIVMIEAQVAHVVQLIERVESGDRAAIEPTAQAQRAFNDEVQQRMQGTVWATGCKSWYVSEDGKNRTLWPDYTFRFRRLLADVDDVAYGE